MFDHNIQIKYVFVLMYIFSFNFPWKVHFDTDAKLLCKSAVLLPITMHFLSLPSGSLVTAAIVRVCTANSGRALGQKAPRRSVVSVCWARRQHALWSEMHKNKIITLQWDKSPSTNTEAWNVFLYSVRVPRVCRTSPKRRFIKTADSQAWAPYFRTRVCM